MSSEQALVAELARVTEERDMYVSGLVACGRLFESLKALLEQSIEFISSERIYRNAYVGEDKMLDYEGEKLINAIKEALK